MSLFDRIPRPGRLRHDNKMMPPAPEQKTSNPETPIPETEPLVQCAACGKSGATNNLVISYFGYITLKYVYLCEACEQERIAGKQQHYTDLHRKPIAAKETLEMSALEVKAKPRRMRKVALVEHERVPSGPLMERTHNLATGA